MKRIAAVGLILCGVGLLLLGLLFIVGARGETRRYGVAVVALAMGAGAVGFGIRIAKALSASSPSRMRADILELARREDGEVSEAELSAFLGERWGSAQAILTRMTASGDCERKIEGGSIFYVFCDLLARLTVRRCEYCNTELPLAEELSNCPNCGGTIKTGVRRVSMSAGEDVYGMDE